MRVVGLPPGPKEHPALQMREFARKPATWLGELSAQYGPIFTVHLLGQDPWVIVGDPDAVRTIFARTADGFIAAADGIKYMLGPEAVIFLEREAHKRERRLLAPHFHQREMGAYADAMIESADATIDALSAGSAITASELMVRITLRTIVEAIFGVTDARKRERLIRLFAEHMAMIQQKPWFIATLLVGGDRIRRGIDRVTRLSRAKYDPSDPPFSRFAPKRFIDTAAEIDDILQGEIDRCRREGIANRTDILAKLARSTYEDGTRMSDAHLKDQLFALLVGGHETTALTMAWAIDLLLRHPDALARTLRELDDALADGPITHARAQKLTYLGAVIDETLRIRPIAQNTPRRTLEPIELGGYHIPAGVSTFPSQILLHFREDLWDRPHEFRPERFLSGRISSFQYFPFGGGSRTCPGRSFALAQMALVIARLLERVRFSLHESAASEVAFHGILMGPSDGVPLVVREVRPARNPDGARMLDARID
jgi:cytochrome P450